MKDSSATQVIVEPYAEALMSLAKEQELVETFGDNVQVILETLKSSEELKQFLNVPLVKDNSKKDVVRQVFEAQVHPVMLHFLQLLVDRRRIFFLEAICLQFQAVLRQMKQVALAEVISAVELNESQEETLRRKVQEITSAHSVELAIKVNPDLIGGVIIKVGSQVIDASIKGQLRRITSRLMTSS